jgi:hypothetical protein
MDTRRFLLVGLPAVLLMAAALVLAEVLDAPWLRAVAVMLLVGVFVAREMWTWWGQGRQWLAMVGTLLAVMLVAFTLQKVTG